MTHLKISYSFETLDETKKAWLAGLYQAEATFTADKRIRRNSSSPDYVPPPPTPIVKLDMVEQDLMNYVGELVSERVLELKRKTTASKTVYRVTIQQKKKTEFFLKMILPYVVGEAKRTQILQLLEYCDQYNVWLANNGKQKASQLALKAKKAKQKKSDSV